MEVAAEVAIALKNVQELELLEASPLADLPRVRQLAEEEFPRAVFRKGFALRRVLFDTVESLNRDLSPLPNYQRELAFLQAYIQGTSVAEISRRQGLSREHVARTVQPKALRLVAKAFAVGMERATR